MLICRPLRALEILAQEIYKKRKTNKQTASSHSSRQRARLRRCVFIYTRLFLMVLFPLNVFFFFKLFFLIINRTQSFRAVIVTAGKCAFSFVFAVGFLRVLKLHRCVTAAPLTKMTDCRR